MGATKVEEAPRQEATTVATLSVEAAVRAVVEACRERGVPPSKVASEFVDSVSGEAAEELKRQGLLYLANNEIHKGRSGPGDSSSESDGVGDPPASGSSSNGRQPQPGWSHTADLSEWDPLNEITLTGAEDGRTPPLAEFTTEDLDAAISRMTGQIVGLTKKRDYLRDARETLDEHDAEKIADLPEDEKDRLRDEAREAWSE